MQTADGLGEKPAPSWVPVPHPPVEQLVRPPQQGPDNTVSIIMRAGAAPSDRTEGMAAPTAPHPEAPRRPRRR